MEERGNMSQLNSIEEAAKSCGVSPWTLRKHLQIGTIQPVRIGRRVLISNTELERICRDGLPALKSRP
jgi:excisionase family DNA binding protein